MFSPLYLATVRSHNDLIGSISPVNQLVYELERVTITCHTFHPPFWKKDGVNIEDDTQFNMNLYYQTLNQNFSIIINRADDRNSGTYTCYGHYENKTMFRSDSLLIVGGEQ